MIASLTKSTAPTLRATLEDPVDDMTEDGRVFYNFSDGGRTVAFGGLTLRAGRPAALARRYAGSARKRRRPVTETLLGKAFDAVARCAWLLTTSAASFFEAAGFSPVARDAAPPAILSTRQAAALCPATAVLQARPIPRGCHD